jgi:hypothetical protein
MLTLEQVKKTLNDPSISDQEALEIRDQLHSLAEIIFEKWQQDKAAGKLPVKPVNGKVSDSSQGSIATGN